MKKLLLIALITVCIASTTKAASQKKSPFIPITSTLTQSPEYLCILIPDQKSALTDTDLKLYQSFFSSLQIPKDFFGNTDPSEPTTPSAFVFDWIDNEASINLKNFANQFTEEFPSLKRKFSKAHSIVITIGRGGQLLNIATHLPHFKTKIDTIIQIGTPLPEKNEKKEKAITRIQKSEILTPKSDTFSRFFHIYSKHAYNHRYLGNHAEQHTFRAYPSTADFNPYNILLLLNNQQVSFQKDVFLPKKETTCTFLGKNLLPLCQKTVALNIPKNGSAWGSISNSKLPSNLLVGLIKKSTGQKLSGTNSEQYDAIWGAGSLANALNLTEGQILRSKYKLTQNSSNQSQQFTHQTT